ncbi:hypothetical protein [Olleya sp. YS]|uniref:GldL-related protein n=1 Tax=Olleya sp. YS TaxID=3028318 RepID=UPI0024341F4A|nr:hypothetical protein [Olleya sp. YS]WGD34008.1 hypothetical protein Ollyesu_09470 [Olleya sp. YS]
MRLTDQHIDYISNNLELYGLKNEALKEDILDHICTYIENTDHANFETAYQNAINKFGGYLNINQIQQETNVQLYFKSAKNRNKLLFASSCLTAILIAIGSLFKIMHWPYASIMLLLGFMLLILITLPVYFYNKYKEKTLKYQS